VVPSRHKEAMSAMCQGLVGQEHERTVAFYQPHSVGVANEAVICAEGAHIYTDESLGSLPAAEFLEHSRSLLTRHSLLPRATCAPASKTLRARAPSISPHVTSDDVPGIHFNGRVTAVDAVVDQTTRNIQVQATLENPGNLKKL
jgi:hypothetical protein